jgi:zinc transporter ZupT
LRFNAGMFIYMGATDLLPEAHSHPSLGVALTVAGFVAMYGVSLIGD